MDCSDDDLLDGMKEADRFLDSLPNTQKVDVCHINQILTANLISKLTCTTT